LSLLAGKLLGIPPSSWLICVGVVRPLSRGRLRLTGPNPSDPVDIDSGLLSDPADLKALLVGIELCRDLGNSAALRPFNKREVRPGDVRGPALERLVRDTVGTYWHPSGTAKMGRDRMSAVDAQLRVHGLDHLRVADASVMPRVSSGHTMAPCVIIGERAAEWIRRQHGL
jgi:choline dehydrogenase